MGEQDNVKTVEAIYAAFARGDLPFILNALAETVDWKHPRPDIPWGGRRSGRDAVAAFFAAVAAHLEIEQFVPEQLIARGDQVIMFGHERARTKPVGRVYGVDWVHVWTLRAGTVIAFREYTDTATIVEALAEMPDASR